MVGNSLVKETCFSYKALNIDEALLKLLNQELVLGGVLDENFYALLFPTSISGYKSEFYGFIKFVQSSRKVQRLYLTSLLPFIMPAFPFLFHIVGC